MRLTIRPKPGRARLGEIAVAIPLCVTDTGHAENVADDLPLKLLHFRTREVEHELVALQFQLAFRLCDHPIRMLLEQFTLGVDHFGFDPNTELEAAFRRFHGHWRQAVRQASAIRLPIAETRPVIYARIFVAEPTVVQKEQLGADFPGRIVKTDDAIKIKVESCRIPTV